MSSLSNNKNEFIVISDYDIKDEQVHVVISVTMVRLRKDIEVFAEIQALPMHLSYNPIVYP
jgi:ribosome-binding factor A